MTKEELLLKLPLCELERPEDIQRAIDEEKRRRQSEKEKRRLDLAKQSLKEAWKEIDLWERFYEKIPRPHREPKEKFTPTENTFGYRWVTDEYLRLYIVKLKITGLYWLDPDVTNCLDYITEACTIIEMKRLADGVTVDSIPGARAYHSQTAPYLIGGSIEGQTTYFCLSEQHLFLSQGQAIERMQDEHRRNFGEIKEP